MTTEQNMQNLKDLRKMFIQKMANLKARKQSVFSQFRSKLEEKKMEEIQKNISDSK